MRARKIQETIQFYLWSIGCIYIFAFGSLYVQIPGLYGSNGLLPVRNVIPELEDNLTVHEHLKTLISFPSLLIYSDTMGLPPEQMMEICCLVGVVLGICVTLFKFMRSSLTFLILWALYLSIHEVGQTFLYFQWDSLLLEAGILTVIVAPMNLTFWKKSSHYPHDVSSFWLIRWFLFRLMFASGVVKLTSMCPTWWDLTALHWHYESQCIPTPLSWYAHQLPHWFQGLSVVGTYAIEILIPFLFFVPVRSVRLFAFWSQIFFQMCIILTGNYNFFNLLTMALCISLIDDSALFGSKKRRVPLDWTRKLTKFVFRKFGNFVHATIRLMIFIAVLVGITVICVYLFDLKIQDYKILSKTSFSVEDLSLALSYAVPAGVILGGLSLLLELIYGLWDSLSHPGFLNKVLSMFQTCLMGLIIVIMFSISIVPFSSLDRSFQSQIPNDIHQLYETFRPLGFSNSYGLFRRMTGVGGRPELIIEGANSEDGPWKEYDFLYKPGNVNSPLPFCFPHQPRLDWQMWFAALGGYQGNPWLVNLIYRLLTGQEEVLELMAPPPFATPPHYVKVSLYTYHYTIYDHSKSLLNQTSVWWSRKYEKEYLYSLSTDHKGLRDYLKQNNLLDVPLMECSVQYLCPSLDLIREYSRILPPPEMLWTIFVTTTIINMMMSCVAQQFKPGKERKKGKNQTKANKDDVTIDTKNSNNVTKNSKHVTKNSNNDNNTEKKVRKRKHEE